MSTIRAAVLIAAKDLRVEARTREAFSSAGLFALLIVVTASFALPTFGVGREGVAAGTVWMAILFATLLTAGRTQTMENEDRCVDALMLAPIPRESVFLGKFLATFAFSVVIEAMLLPAFMMLMRLPLGSPRALALLVAAVVLGTTGLVGLGTLLGMMATRTRMQQAFLPMLVMPVVVPLMIAAVQVTQAAFADAGLADTTRWLAMLVGFDAVFLLVAVVTFPYVVEE